MKINNTGYSQYIEKTYKENKQEPGKLQDDKAVKRDRIELSDSFKEIKKYFSKTEDSGINLERVQQIKDAIGSGTYRVSSEELAGKIIQKMKE